MALENNSSRNPGQKDDRPGKSMNKSGINPRNSSSSAIGIRLISDIDKMLASRYELKYHVSEAQACAITEYIKPYLHLDRYSTILPGHDYPIVSLYLDSDNLRLCHETLTGKKNRFKLRIRSYSDDPESPCFFEIKRRINNIIVKSRARVSKADVADLLAGKAVTQRDHITGMQALRQFEFYMNSLNARPVILVRYMRQAFESDTDNRVRITFDRSLESKCTREPKVTLNGPGWQRIPIDFVVLEIKFTAKYPAWLSDMVRVFDLKQAAMSKYASSVKHSSSLGCLLTI